MARGGPALGIKHGFRAMRPGGPGNSAGASGGAIVNVASAAATIAFPGIAGYSATKSAVDRLTRAAAMESGSSTAARACDNSKKRRVSAPTPLPAGGQTMIMKG
jgi:NAD(P)-dependent dehydrogenase (short-subunit alcohol dehydrogenase family)